MPRATIRGKYPLKTVVIFGAGSGGKRVISDIPPDTRVAAFCDNDNRDRVMRGGAWNSTQTLLRTAFRLSVNPSNQGGDVGARLVRPRP